MSAIPAGYKQTEVGLIPESWKVRPFGELATTVASGRSKVGATYGKYAVHGSTGVIGYCEEPEYEGDAILVARVGANAGKLNTVAGKYGVTDNTIILRVRSDSSLLFFYRQLEKKRLNSLVFGSGQPLITGSQLKALVVCEPPLPEQRAIAAALSDADALLAKLDQFIAKKRDLKQSAMQQLLTGQTRLPGFSGAWDVVDFESLCRSFTKQTGFDYSSSIKPSLTFEDTATSLPFIQNKDFSGKETNYETDYFVPESIANNFPRILLNERCLLISISGRVGNVGVFSNTRKAFVGGAIAVSKFTNPDQLSWVMYYFQSQAGQNKLLGNVKAGSHQNLTLEDLRKIEIPLPTLEEQETITTILSDMDAELAALEARRDKTRALKQGMMQELLTGRIRLL